MMILITNNYRKKVKLLYYCVSLRYFVPLRMKRESGVNPEQTRCCKLWECLYQNTTVAKWEGDMSKSESEDLQSNTFDSFRGIRLKKHA
jgi:hypothetical protein